MEKSNQEKRREEIKGEKEQKRKEEKARKMGEERRKGKRREEYMQIYQRELEKEKTKGNQERTDEKHKCTVCSFVHTCTVLLTGHWEQETLENFDCKFAKNQILVL